ncbi:MAG: tRNA uracil 4-sulfurtransferase ThiI [Christensenellales bacterium]
MEYIILAKYAEIHLKGKNRPFFERKLRENMRMALYETGAIVEKGEGRVHVSGFAPHMTGEIVERLKRVFGVHSISPAVVTDKQFASVLDIASRLMEEELAKRGGSATFKVEARRSDKTYPMNSMAINRELGSELLSKFDGLKVDVHKPDIMVLVEIRDRAYVYLENIPAARGMPVGTGGKASLLLSGGIDSPVAGHMMLKRGVALECIHFFSFPYTGEPAKKKVMDLCGVLARYCGSIRLHVVPFTKIQTEIYEKCPEQYLTILMRRYMMRIAEKLAEKTRCSALVTGESLGQVASQTMEGLACTDAVVNMPVFRPLIGFDKLEIIERANNIGSYDISILPYDDCCTVFVPKHPATQPKIKDIEKSELKMPEGLVDEAVEATEQLVIKPLGFMGRI